MRGGVLEKRINGKPNNATDSDKRHDLAEGSSGDSVDELPESTGGRCLSESRPHGLASLFNSRVLTDLASKVVQLRSADLASAGHFKLGYVRRMDGERSLNRHAVGDLSDVDGFGNSAILDGDDHAFVNLNSLFAGLA